MKKTLSLLLALCLLAASLPAALTEEPDAELTVSLDFEEESAPAEVTDGDLVFEFDGEGVSDPDDGEEPPLSQEEEGAGASYARLLCDAPVCESPDGSGLLATLPAGSHVLVVEAGEAALKVAFAVAENPSEGYIPSGDVVMLTADEVASLMGELAVSGPVLLYEGDLDRPLPAVGPLEAVGSDDANAGEPPEDTSSAEVPAKDTSSTETTAPASEATDDPEAENPIEVEPIDGPSESGEDPTEPEGSDQGGGNDPEAPAEADPELAEARSEEIAEDSPDDEALLAMEPVVETVECFIDSGKDSDALFAGYASRILYRGSTRARRTMATCNAGEQLTGQDRIIYEALKPQIQEIAAGKRSSTTLKVPVATVLGQESFTAAEAAERLKNLYSWNINLVTYALWFDCTYEMYWFDRYSSPVNSAWSNQPFSGVYDSAAGAYIYNVDGQSITFSFPVLEHYRLDGAQYMVDPTLIQGAKDAEANARAIVNRYAAYSDYVKLFGYAKEICDLVSYNSAAAAGELPDSVQDPWKLIWVFDGDSSTNVVCEGYSQAFQYLCELTDFNGGIRCLLVTGYAGGAHSWNVVRMDDGKNYVVDVTWMDTDYDLNGLSGSMADWINNGKGRLFLCGASSGSVSGGYAVDYRAGGGQSSRTYRNDTLNAYSASALTLAESKYVLTGFQRIGNSTYFFGNDGRYVTGTQLLGDAYYDFDASGRLQGVPSGWRTVSGRRYFFESDGALHTRHTKVIDAAVAPTCTESGLTEGSHCSVCGTVLKAQETVAAIGHSWGEATYTWNGTDSVTATRTCLNDPAHVETETVNTAPAITRAATCTVPGQTTYTATFASPAFSAQSRAADDIPTLPHTPVETPEVPATYTSTGLTRGAVCKVCGAVLEGRQVIPKLDCTFHMKKSAKKTVNIGVPIRIVVDGKKIKSCKSSNKKVATVSKKGWVTTKKAGTAKITITPTKGKKLTLTVKVVDPYAPKSVKIKQGKKTTMKKGQKLALQAVLYPTYAKTTLKWTTSDKRVATVSKAGVVTAKKAGKVRITVTTKNKKKATITITVKK